MTAYKRLALDAGLFVALLLAYYPARTGLTVHEWLSLAIVVPVLFHFAINWEWTVHAAERFSARLRASSRVNFVVDALLFVALVAAMVSGLMVSRVIAVALGISSSPSVIWVALHSVAADATIALLIVHLGLHWRWIFRTLGLTGRSAPMVRPAEGANAL